MMNQLKEKTVQEQKDLAEKKKADEEQALIYKKAKEKEKEESDK